MKAPLTSRQQEVYSLIRSHILEKEQSPTLGELAKLLKVGSLNTVVQLLKSLEQKGYIIRRRHAKRSITLREPTNSLSRTTTIPVLSSAGCDDLSVFADENHDEYLEVDKKLVEGKGKVVAVRAVGNSMNEADIHDGDYILIQQADTAEEGDRVAAIIGDMITVKRFERENGLIILRPESNDSKYKPIILSEDFKIAGKVLLTIPGDSRDITRFEKVSDGPADSFSFNIEA